MYSAGKVVFHDLTTHLLASALRPRRTQKTRGRASHVRKNICVLHPGGPRNHAVGCHVCARRKNVRVKIYCIRRSTYGSTSGPNQSVENTPLATQLHHANVAQRIDVVSSVSTSHDVSCSRRFFYFPSIFLVVITPRQARATLRVCPCKG